MRCARLGAILAAHLWLVSCASSSDRETLADLHNVKADTKEVKIEGGIEKAIQSYRHFLEETPESGLTPEAIRRLADLKVQKEYGTSETATKSDRPAGKKIDKPEKYDATRAIRTDKTGGKDISKADALSESQKEFEKRATENHGIKSTAGGIDAALPEGADDLQNASALEAIALYKKLLAKYPNYERNDQALYNMSRAYEELGQVEEAMKVMTRIVTQYPKSRYIDEVQFRRGEYFFTRRKYLDAEDAYKAVEAMGPGSSFYELSLYKLGWTFYKQELYEDALQRFIGVLDYKVSTGYDFEKTHNEIEGKRVDDTFRIISLSFSNLGGSSQVVDYFSKIGKRPYELNIYSNLGEYYLDKRRYADAAAAYQTFVKRNHYHKIAPHFDLAGALGDGRLALADPASVPAGKYAKAALTSLGVWDSIASKVAPAENVRVALEYVARGEAPFGIVYATDARVSPSVKVVGIFPEDSHAPITYPVALTKSASPAARDFLVFLSGSSARAIFQRAGFTPR